MALLPRRPLLLLAFTVLALVSATSPAHAEEPALAARVRAFLDAKTVEARQQLAAGIVAEKPDFARVADALAVGRTYRKDVPTGWLERTQRCADGKDRPYLLYVPPDYDPARRYRLVVELHGGVSRPVLPSYEDLEGLKQLRGAHAEQNGYLLALPAGEKQAEWWTDVGASNVLGIVAATKREYDVDENLVFATGFSDGGSGSYYLALTHPTPFAGFEPLNGHVGVAAAGGLEVHLRGLRNRPIYAVNTDQDGLYPSAALKPVAEAVQALGAPFVWREVTGFGHDPSYLATERAPIWAWEQKVTRSAHPATIVWEGTATAPSRVHGLGRVTVAARPGGAATFPDVNPLLPPGRPKLGITIDQEFTGPGVRIAEVTKGSPAESAGLEKGDVIVGLDAADVQGPRDLRTALGAKKPGDGVRLRARRGETVLEKEATLPDVKPEPAFERGATWGAIELTQKGNVFTASTRNVAGFELWLGVGTVDFAAPVTVTVDGTEVFRKVVAPDLAFLLERAAEDDDRTMLYGASLRIELPTPAK